MHITFDRVVSVVLTACAITIAGSVVYRTFSGPQPATSDGPPELVAEWTDALAVGTRVGPLNAPVTIVEIADLECPVCRTFHTTVTEVLREYPKDVAVVHVMYPLSYHKHAMPAARAAECANSVGKFAAWLDVVYAKQDSLGLKSWGSFAHEAGIADTTMIADCARNPVSVPRIEAARAYGDKIGVKGTPTILVNGWMLSSPPSKANLDRAIAAVLKGTEPFPGGRVATR